VVPQKRARHDPAEVPAEKRVCRWCGASIEEQTAARNRGRCTPCSQKNYFSFLLNARFLPHLRRKRIERLLANSTVEALRPSAEEIRGAKEFANYFDPTGAFAELVELAATKPEAALDLARPWLSSARTLLNFVAGKDDKEKAYYIYQEDQFMQNLVKSYLLERNWAFVYDYDATLEELVERMTSLQTPWTSQVDWAHLSNTVEQIEDTHGAMKMFASFLRGYDLTISPLRGDPNDVCIVVRTADFPRIQHVAKQAGLFDLFAS
jgi:hypothetical protein